MRKSSVLGDDTSQYDLSLLDDFIDSIGKIENYSMKIKEEIREDNENKNV